MVFLRDWEDFEIAAETMYIQSPDKCRFVVKYLHSKGLLQLKLTDNVKVRTHRMHTCCATHVQNSNVCIVSLQCIQYKTEIMPDLKKIERLTGNLMLHMASKD